MLIYDQFPFVRFIEEKDLLKFMIDEAEVNLLWPHFEVDKTKKIDMKGLTNWVVRPCIYYLSSVILSHQAT